MLFLLIMIDAYEIDTRKLDALKIFNNVSTINTFNYQLGGKF